MLYKNSISKIKVQTREQIIKQIEKASSHRNSFNDIALQIFFYQYQNNKVFQSFVNSLNIRLESIKTIEQIPFLPISVFKFHELKTGNFIEETIFRSSGTTQDEFRSQHFIKDKNWYEGNAKSLFEKSYGPITNFTFLALLPHYLESKDSSLVTMVRSFMKYSGQLDFQFYLYDFASLNQKISDLRFQNKKTILFGVTYALLDFIAVHPQSFNPKLTIIETGGMKGRKNEMIKSELHNILSTGFGGTNIHSEYGMTELLSQAYSQSGQEFDVPYTMKILIRDVSDPMSYLPLKRRGALNIIDLANFDSCSFIATDDLGQMITENKFKLLGRMDASDIRGCSLLYTS